MEIGSMIKNARNQAMLTQEQAAEVLGVSRQTISNWENGRSYPDIVSVIKMSDLYSVSLDHLLKEETSMKQTYREFLEESTNTVKSRERQSKVILALMTLGIWALSVAAFWLGKNGPAPVGYSLVFLWAVLPVLFFTVSYIIGQYQYFGRLRWMAVLLFGVMYSLSGSISVIAIGGYTYKTIVWPDISKFLIGLAVSLAGLGSGTLLRKRKSAGMDA